jgi:subtilase family serine protease
MKLKSLAVSLALLSAFSTINTYAAEYLPGRAHHPIHIKKIPTYMNKLVSGMSPQQVRVAYALNQLTVLGKGQTIALIDAYDHPAIESDLGVFSAAFNLPACTTANGCFKKKYAGGSQPVTDPGWATEIALDVEWAHAIAPAANIMLVEAATNSLQDLFQAVRVAISSGATVISMSWGGGEGSYQTNFDAIFSASPTVAFTASSGDSGFGVSYPASSPYVIAVGGTTLSVDANGKRLSETAWAGSGGGISAIETMPAYQQSYPLPNNPQLKRGVPDVAYNADPNTGFAVYDSIPVQGQSGWLVVGGTSAGSTGSCGYYCNAQMNYDYVTGLGSPDGLYLINMIIREHEGYPIRG